MKHVRSATLLALTAGIALAMAAPASAQITFDDLDHVEAIPNGYGGLNWSNFSAHDGSGAPGSGYNTGRVSSPNVAFNLNANPAELSSLNPFMLNSGYFTAAWNNGLTLNVYGYLDGSQSFFESFILNTTGPSLLTFNWEVDRVRFVSSGGVNQGLGGAGAHFAMDNLTINAAQSVVPEPMSMVLLGTGLAGVAVIRRRKREMIARQTDR
jgi:hypothetical protein